MDLDADGSTERLLCDLRAEYVIYCTAWALDGGRWTSIGRTSWRPQPDGADIRDAIRAGKVEVKRRRWGDVVVAGKNSTVD